MFEINSPNTFYIVKKYIKATFATVAIMPDIPGGCSKCVHMKLQVIFGIYQRKYHVNSYRFKGQI